MPQLLPVTASDDKRAVRLAYYLLQLQLGAGAAGTPTLPPMRGEGPHPARRISRADPNVDCWTPSWK